MPDKPKTNTAPPDPADIAGQIAGIAERSQRLVRQFFERQAGTGGAIPGDLDPLGVGKAFLELGRHLMRRPDRLLGMQYQAWQGHLDLWRHTANRMLGIESPAVAEPSKDDRRFRHAQWSDNPVFDYIKQSYLVAARAIQSAVRDIEGLDPKTAGKVDFYTRQFVDALAPTNFVMTNPEVLEATLASGGQNLLKGLGNVLEDLEGGAGRLRIRMTEETAFELGRNVALTPGSVVFQNALMQLIQYRPATPAVYRRPLLILPPWINKFYVLDLQPKNSFIRWAVEQGHTVFVVSWVNPDERLAGKTFEDYLLEGPLAALDQIELASGEREVNAVGYCLGGTLLAATLAYLAAKDDERIASATFLASMIDFSEPGELGVFIDEEQLESLETRMREKGYLEGREMAATFNMLRANDLIWSFVINNYLLGKDPFPFDLLYWNSDSTRMPAAMHSFYLRKTYQENVFKDPGGITLAGVPIDISKVKTPVYFLSTREDHIAPWKSTYAGAKLFGGPVRFAVGMSGHIAGVINPPEAGKYGYWTRGDLAETAEEWLAGATEQPGSWWPDWARWVGRYAGGRVPARHPGDGALACLEDAPGSYVRVRS
jgi:polyhydroxyalkanoate synthase